MTVTAHHQCRFVKRVATGQILPLHFVLMRDLDFFLGLRAAVVVGIVLLLLVFPVHWQFLELGVTGAE